METVSEPKADAQAAWQGGQSPSMAYTSVGESFMTPATLASEQGSTKKGIMKTLKTIGVGLITAYIVLTLAGGLGAFYIWKKGWIEFHWPWEQNQAVAAAQSGESAAQSETEAAAVPAEQPAESQSAAPSDESQETESVAATSVANSDEDGYEYLLGTWSGTGKADDNNLCYGAERVPLELTITKVNDSYITANIKVTYHNHDTLYNESDGIDKDELRKYDDVEMWIKDGKFTCTPDEYIHIDFEINNGEISAKVKSTYHNLIGIPWYDKYKLTKE